MTHHQTVQDDEEDAFEFVQLPDRLPERTPPSWPAEGPFVKPGDPTPMFTFQDVPEPQEEADPMPGLSAEDQAAVEIARDLGVPIQAAKTFVGHHFRRLGPDRFWSVLFSQAAIHGPNLKLIGKGMTEAYFAEQGGLEVDHSQKAAERRVHVAKTWRAVILAAIRGDLKGDDLKAKIEETTAELAGSR